MKIAITGSFYYLGKYITRRLAYDEAVPMTTGRANCQIIYRVQQSDF